MKRPLSASIPLSRCGTTGGAGVAAIIVAAAVASSSQRSFSLCPTCPRIQLAWTVCSWSSTSRRTQRSTFLTSRFAVLLRFQPKAFHFPIHDSIAFTTYWLSLKSSTSQGPFKASKPRMTAVTSMRLLVVLCSPPLTSFELPVAGCLRIKPQPPGPGLPMHEPSVNSLTKRR